MAFPKYKRRNPFLLTDDPVPLPENSVSMQHTHSELNSAFPLNDQRVVEFSVDLTHHQPNKLSLCREDESVYERTLRLLREGALAQGRAQSIGGASQGDSQPGGSLEFGGSSTDGANASFMEDDDDVAMDLSHHSKGFRDIRQFFAPKPTPPNSQDVMDQG